MSNIVQAKKPYTHPYGDFIYGEDIQFAKGNYVSPWLGKFSKDILNLNLLHLEYINPNTWFALQKMGVENAELLNEEFSYECPYTQAMYCAVAPIAIATDRPLEDFFKDEEYKPWFYGMLMDKEWNDMKYPIDVDNPRNSINGVMRAYMGSGYTDGTMINDGDYSFDLSVLDIDNGDMVICTNLVWHNK